MCHVHSLHHSSSLYFSCCTLPPSTCLNHSQQQHPSLLCSLYLYYLCTFFILHAQCLYILFKVPWFYSLGCSLPLHFCSTSLTQASTHSLCSACSPHVESLPDNHGNSSSFLVVMRMHSSSLSVMLRFLSLSSSRDSSSSLS
jgi:hypothetical protein